MKVSFELSNRDIRYFRERLREAKRGATEADEATVIEGAEELLEEARAAEPPEFVLERLVTLEHLIAMLQDEDWRLEGRDRARILHALAYFVDPEDMIPDKLPGIGYIDDAIMVQLVAQELKHEIQAYEDFCGFRDTEPERAQALEKRRAALQHRMRRRRRRERAASSARGRQRRSPLRLW